MVAQPSTGQALENHKFHGLWPREVSTTFSQSGRTEIPRPMAQRSKIVNRTISSKIKTREKLEEKIKKERMSGCACLPFNKKAPKEASSAAAVKVDSLKKPTTKQTTPPSKGMDPVERLKSGFQQFKTNVYDKKPELFEPLKEGQAPTYMVFSCADSRCCPSVTLGLQPGEAFTMRNIASMVGPYDKSKYTGTGSAIEYAVCALKVKVIVVIGHSRCGGIKALLSMQDGAPDNFHFVEDWVRIGHPAKKKVQTECKMLPFDEQCSMLERAAVNVSLENLKSYPFVKEGLANGTLKLVGGHYDFVNGKFELWDFS